VFVDHAQRALGAVRRNLEQCGLGGSADLLRHDLRRGLPPGIASRGRGFGLVFLDPPYGRALADPLLAPLGRTGFLEPDALVVVETGAGEDPGDHEGLVRLESRPYGETRIHLFGLESGSGA
jgi:16S rRNA G966 N2-methylase RsmD